MPRLLPAHRPRRLVVQTPAAIQTRLRENNKDVYRPLAPVLQSSPDILLTGPDVVKLVTADEEDWDPLSGEDEDSQLEIYCLGDLQTWVRVVRALMPEADELTLDSDGVAQVELYGTEITVRRLRGSTPLEVLETYPMTHLQVGLVQGELVATDGWRRSIRKGVSVVQTPDVAERVVEVERWKGYPVQISSSTRLILDAEWLSRPRETCHWWSLAEDLASPRAAWRWLQQAGLRSPGRRHWWALVVGHCEHLENYYWAGPDGEHLGTLDQVRRIPRMEGVRVRRVSR